MYCCFGEIAIYFLIDWLMVPYYTRLQVIFGSVKKKLLYKKCGDARIRYKVSMDIALFSSKEVVRLENANLDIKLQYLCSSVAGLLLLRAVDEIHPVSRPSMWPWDLTEKIDAPPCLLQPWMAKFCLERFQSLASPQRGCCYQRVILYIYWCAEIFFVFSQIWGGSTDNPQQGFKRNRGMFMHVVLCIITMTVIDGAPGMYEALIIKLQ